MDVQEVNPGKGLQNLSIMTILNLLKFLIIFKDIDMR